VTNDEARNAAPSGFAEWASQLRRALDGRHDLVTRADVAITRVGRASSVVAVVGEFKQGKSALVNSLLGAAVCPVDDHLATSRVTVVSYAPTPAVVARHRDESGALVATQMDPAWRDALITDDPDRPASGLDSVAPDPTTIERIDLYVPHPLLADGLVLVDTPGVGGLSPAHAAATRAFLASADAVVFVSDATSELTETEVGFLREVVEVCPHVIVALTKIDLVASWRRVRELDHEHLATASIDLPIFPVSYPLRIDSLRAGGSDVDPHARAASDTEQVSKAVSSESGYPELLAHLVDGVAPRARSQAERRSVEELVRLLRLASETDRRELDVLDDPDRTDAELEALREARQQLSALGQGNARWRTVLNDAVTDVSQAVTFAFRDRIRSALAQFETAVDEADDSDALDAAVEGLRDAVVGAVAGGFDEIERGVEQVTITVASVLGLDELAIESFDSAEVSQAVIESSFDIDQDDDGSVAGDVFSAMRGAQGGVLMIAVMGSLLPAAAAATVAAAPFMIGAGVLFGGKSIVDIRKQRRQRERQRVKLAARRGVDDAQFRVGNELSDSLRGAQRHLRDELSERIDELQRSTNETITRLERSTSTDAAERERRRADLRRRLAVVEQLVSGPTG
jgi:GTP-binding protein EngB required for normal cell division